jgi:hypothetical protein
MKKPVLFLAIAFTGCAKSFDGPDFYQDDFESYASFGELLPEGDVKWSFTQQTRDGNDIALDSSLSVSGGQSLKFTAFPTDDDGASKSSIAKQNMAFREGETMRVSAYYYLASADRLDWLFLMDLEEQTAIGAGPGMRLALVDNRLRVEYKFNQNDIVQPEGQEIAFPRSEWVKLTLEVKLSRKKKGSVKLWQNGSLVIDADNKITLPKDVLYFQQGTKGMYSSVELGITANSRHNSATLYVDDVLIERVD